MYSQAPLGGRQGVIQTGHGGGCKGRSDAIADFDQGKGPSPMESGHFQEPERPGNGLSSRTSRKNATQLKP